MNYIRYSSQSGLTDSDVIDMRVAAQSEELTTSDIGDMYNIDRTTAARIISGRTWTHVPSPRQIGNYTIYPDGRIFSKSAGRFMQTSVGKDGQQYVELRSNGNREKVAVAVLVARAFLGTKSNKIGFANGDTSDVHFTNLVVASKQ
jgi:hypothetical protein